MIKLKIINAGGIKCKNQPEDMNLISIIHKIRNDNGKVIKTIGIFEKVDKSYYWAAPIVDKRTHDIGMPFVNYADALEGAKNYA